MSWWNFCAPCLSRTRSTRSGLILSSTQRTFRPINTAGEDPVIAWGVTLYLAKNRDTRDCKDPPCIFFIARLNTWTPRSAKPFVDGWYGAEVRCLIPFTAQKLANLSLTNWGPLSVTKWTGKPVDANVISIFSMVASAEVLPMICTSIHFEWASINNRKSFPKNGPKTSAWTLYQGLEGHSQGCKGTPAGSLWWTWQMWQPFASCSMSRSRFGQ